MEEGWLLWADEEEQWSDIGVPNSLATEIRSGDFHLEEEGTEEEKGE